MARPFVSLIAALALCAGGGCATAVQGLYPPPVRETAKTVYVISNGWHAGLALRRADIPEGLWPEQHDIPATEYLEVGWGNEGFYMAPRVTAGIALRALVPSPSVLHVAGFNVRPDYFFRDADIVAVALSEPGFATLCRYVQASYAHDGLGRPINLGPGLYGVSSFYRATGKYYLPKTCNVWTAGALRAAGCPITPACAVTAGNVVRQTRRFGDLRRSR